VTSCDAAAIDPTAQIAPTAIIDLPFRPLLDGRQVEVDRGTVIEAGVWIGPHTTIGQGVRIGAHSMLEQFIDVQTGTAIGSRVLVTSRSSIGIGVTVGSNSVINKATIGDYARIGKGCRIAGDLIHRQLDPTIPWDDAAESAPILTTMPLSDGEPLSSAASISGRAPMSALARSSPGTCRRVT